MWNSQNKRAAFHKLKDILCNISLSLVLRKTALKQLHRANPIVPESVLDNQQIDEKLFTRCEEVISQEKDNIMDK